MIWILKETEPFWKEVAKLFITTATTAIASQAVEKSFEKLFEKKEKEEKEEKEKD